MTTKIIILNGPPESGKDTLANFIVNANYRDFVTTKFAYPLKRACKEAYGVSDNLFNAIESNHEMKNRKMDIFFGKSWREVNIDMSEKFFKKQHGKDVFGKILVNRIMDLDIDNITVVLSDGGFNEEVVPLIEKFGSDNVFLVKLFRKGKDFENDSRKYIDGEKLGIETFELHNKHIPAFCNDGAALASMLSKGVIPSVRSNK